jgi:ferritin-like metal-binding protein YciE
MPNRNDEVLIMTLRNARKHSAQSSKAYRQLSEAAESVEFKRDLESWASDTENDLKSLDRCFERIGTKPADLSFPPEDAFAPDLKAELAQMQTSMGRQLYILVKASELALRSMAGYPILISAAEEAGYFDVSALLEAIVARRLAHMQKHQRLMQDLIESSIAQTGRLATLQRAA